MVPDVYNTKDRFGDQVGLTYLKAPGIIVMPGYGATFVIGDSRLFVSPLALLGAGVAFNSYRGDRGRATHANMEYGVYAMLNTGYNGDRLYGRIQLRYELAYAPIRPAYLTSTDLMVSLLMGFRFAGLTRFTHHASHKDG